MRARNQDQSNHFHTHAGKQKNYPRCTRAKQAYRCKSDNPSRQQQQESQQLHEGSGEMRSSIARLSRFSYIKKIDSTDLCYSAEMEL
jgi:hypothetical protein